MEIEYDASLSAYEVKDETGKESEVIYIPSGYLLDNNPFFRVGMRRKKFVIISQEIDGKRINRLLIDRHLVQQLR